MSSFLHIYTLSFAALLSYIIETWVANDVAIDFLTNSNRVSGVCNSQSISTCDFVVVGGGSAGMVVATRLANNTKDYSVLVLEAGGEPSPINALPSMATLLSSKPDNCWIYPSEVQEHAGLFSDNQRILTTRGKMLGGSSQTNFMAYVRGNKEDYNRWAKELGDESWSYENILPYFKLSENYQGYFDETYHGYNGLLSVEPQPPQPMLYDFLAAAEQKGYKLGDYNGEDQAVFSQVDVTTDQGIRESTYRAYYQSTGKSANLEIKKYALATKIILNKRKRAVGVTYERHGCQHSVRARKEVILSAGTIGSAQLLMLSGIGPREHLESLGIPVVKDLPVGESVQDHPYTIAGPFLKSQDLKESRRTVSTPTTSTFAQLANSDTSQNAGLCGQGFLQSPVATPSYPDVQVIQTAIPLAPDTPEVFNQLAGINKTVLGQWWGNKSYSDARFVLVILTRPKSSGFIKLLSMDPKVPPRIDPKYLAHPEDVEALLYGMKAMVNLYENTTALNAQLMNNPVPGCENFEFKSDDYFRCGIRGITGSLFHHVGSCGMGRVVDAQLRVLGIPGLRVIDASVMPRLPAGNTFAPTLMIAEKGADLIWRKWCL